MNLCETLWHQQFELWHQQVEVSFHDAITVLTRAKSCEPYTDASARSDRQKCLGCSGCFGTSPMILLYVVRSYGGSVTCWNWSPRFHLSTTCGALVERCPEAAATSGLDSCEPRNGFRWNDGGGLKILQNSNPLGGFFWMPKKKDWDSGWEGFCYTGVVFSGAMRIRNWPSIRVLIIKLIRTLDKEDLTLFWLHPRNQWILRLKSCMICWGWNMRLRHFNHPTGKLLARIPKWTTLGMQDTQFRDSRWPWSVVHLWIIHAWILAACL